MERKKGTLAVSHTYAGEVVVDHPDLCPDEDGVGHIIFSPSEAENFARVLLIHAHAARELLATLLIQKGGRA